jgi:hypothetical protein
MGARVIFIVPSLKYGPGFTHSYATAVPHSSRTPHAPSLDGIDTPSAPTRVRVKGKRLKGQGEVAAEPGKRGVYPAKRAAFTNIQGGLLEKGQSDPPTAEFCPFP